MYATTGPTLPEQRLHFIITFIYLCECVQAMHIFIEIRGEFVGVLSFNIMGYEIRGPSLSGSIVPASAFLFLLTLHLKPYVGCPWHVSNNYLESLYLLFSFTFINNTLPGVFSAYLPPNH